MPEDLTSLHDPQGDHLSWVRTRLTLDRDFMEWIRHGFSLITVGFGSFAFLEGIRGALGGTEARSVTEPSRVFSLAATAIGVALLLIALRHNRKMVDFVNADAFDDAPELKLPNERREEILAVCAIVIGVISFISLLFLR